MKFFMDKDFLLSTDTAKQLYHEFAAKMPILDYHCHIEPRVIAENKEFKNIAQLWLSGDHYKWRLMRSNGVEEHFITGTATDREKFQKWAEVIEKAIGNPLYHWSHLELQRYFDYKGALNGNSAEEVWQFCNAKIKETRMSARSIIRKSNVVLICTTDDPADSLEWHEAIAKDPCCDVKVLPAFRPDRVMNIEKPDYTEYLGKLSKRSGVDIVDYSSLKKAVEKRIEFFASAGCRVSDHALGYVMFKPVSDDEANCILKKALMGTELTLLEQLQFKTAFMLFVGKLYHRHGWVMQLHYGIKRDNNRVLYEKLGPDTGFDCICRTGNTGELTDFLNALLLTGGLPKTILYSADPVDNTSLGSITGCFQDSSAIGKIQQGSAWWFNDNKTGMTEHMTALANQGLLGNFIGMLTDSRSLLSYTRHEYFRRILCDLIGGWVESGEYPYDLNALSRLVEDISFYNSVRYFGFDLEKRHQVK